MTKTFRIALLVAVALTFSAPAAHADTSSDASAILTNVAAHVSHGFANYSTSYADDEQIIAAGGHVSVLCGQVSELGMRALQRAGITVRYVGAFASQRADLMDVPADVIESHSMLEVWTGARWELYDLDGNVQPLDENGDPVTLLQFVDMPERHYRTLATDALYDPTADRYPLYESWVYSNHEAWYDRVLDIPAIWQGNGYAYTGPKSSPVASLPGYAWVTPEALADYATWAPAATSAPAASPAPAPAAVSPSVAAASPVAAVAPAAAPAAHPVAAAKAPARKRFVTRVRHRKVFHVYGHGRKARWVYVRRMAQ